MATDHSILVRSSGGNPEPVGISADPYSPSPTQDPWNPWICQYPCQLPGHTDTVWMYWDGKYFSVTDGTVWSRAGDNNTPVATPDEADDPLYGCVYIHYDPPIDNQ